MTAAFPAVVFVEGVAHGGTVASRVVRASLFADVKGFSKLRDEQLLRFAEHVLGAYAVVLVRYGDEIAYRNTRG